MNWLKNNLDRVLYILTLFLFAFIPLYPKFPLLNISGTYVAVRLEDLLIGLTLALWIWYLIINKNFSFFTKDNIGRSFILFFAIGCLSLFSGVFLTHSVVPHLGLLHLFRRIEFMLLLPVIATVFTTRKRFMTALMVLVMTLAAVNIFALGQKYLDWPVISTTNSEFAKGLPLKLTPGARVNSTFAGHYDLAVFLDMALILLTTLIFAFRKLIKPMFLILGVVSTLVLVMTAARVSFIAAFVGLIAALILSKKKKYLLLLVIIAMAIAVYPSQLRDRFISTVTINLLDLGQRYEGRNLNQQLENKLNIPTLYYRISSRSATGASFASPTAGIPIDIAPGEPINVTDLGVYRSFEIRLNIEWPRAVNAFLKNPFLGTGYASLGIATDNDFLRSLGEVGILGTTAFILVLLSIWKTIYKGIKSDEKIIRFFSAGSLSIIIVFLINSVFIDVFEASKVAALLWMILGLNIGLIRNK